MIQIDEDTSGYATPNEKFVEILFNNTTKEMFPSLGTNLGLAEARKLLPGCTHITLDEGLGKIVVYAATEYRDVYGKLVHGWDVVHDLDDVPPELKVLQSIT